MAKLTKAKRDALPSTAFGLPKSEGFPMNDKTHDRLAISGATRAERAGHISRGTEARIKAEAREKLHARQTKGRAEQHAHGTERVTEHHYSAAHKSGSLSDY